MRRFLAFLLLGVLFLQATPLTANAHDHSWRWGKCRFQYKDGKKNWSPTEVKLTIKCAEHKFPSSLTTALYIAERESGFRQFAKNPYSSASGVYQFIDSTWSSLRYNHLSKFARRWKLHTSVWDARANVMIAVKWAARSGWCPTWC